MPGGVSSPVRAFRAVGGNPPVIATAPARASSTSTVAAYIDYVCAYGPLILGHAPPPVVAVLAAAAERGTAYGATSELEVELARRIVDAIPSVDMVRFVNSGTEATMSALRLARAFTKRSKVIKFEGGYHGHADGLLVQAGSGPGDAQPAGQPGRAGVVRREHARRAVQQPRRGADAVRRSRRRHRRCDHRAGGGEHGRRAAGAGVPGRAARAGARLRRASRLRRGDHGLSAVLRQRADGAWRGGGHHVPRQGDRRRAAGRCVRGTSRDHGDGRAAWARCTRRARFPETRWRWRQAW